MNPEGKSFALAILFFGLLALVIAGAMSLGGCAIEQTYTESDVCRKRAETPHEYHQCR